MRARSSSRMAIFQIVGSSATAINYEVAGELGPIPRVGAESPGECLKDVLDDTVSAEFGAGTLACLDDGAACGHVVVEEAVGGDGAVAVVAGVELVELSLQEQQQVVDRLGDVVVVGDHSSVSSLRVSGVGSRASVSPIHQSMKAMTSREPVVPASAARAMKASRLSGSIRMVSFGFPCVVTAYYSTAGLPTRAVLFPKES